MTIRGTDSAPAYLRINIFPPGVAYPRPRWPTIRNQPPELRPLGAILVLKALLSTILA